MRFNIIWTTCVQATYPRLCNGTKSPRYFQTVPSNNDHRGTLLLNSNRTIVENRFSTVIQCSAKFLQMQDCECTLENGKATKLYKTKTLLCDHNRASMVMPGLVRLWSPKNSFGPHQVLAKSTRHKYVLVCGNENCKAEKSVCLGDLTRGLGRFIC